MNIFVLRWIVRPAAFVAPLTLAGWWFDIPPTWQMAALTFFCIFWADAAHLFGMPADIPPVRTVRGGGRVARWRWDFGQFEAILLGAFAFAGRAFVFAVPTLVVAWGCGLSMGWKLIAWIAICVVLDRGADRIGARRASQVGEA